MERNPYFYFKDLYKNSNELIICTDKNLKIIYLTDTFRFKYNFCQNGEVTTNCIIPTRFFTMIINAISNGESVSFDYIDIHDSEPKKCVVLPTELSGEMYASLLIIESTKLSFDSRQNAKLKYEIARLDASVRDYASKIISDVRVQNKDSKTDPFNNRIFLNALKIRIESENLAVLARTDLRVQRSYIINLNEYIKRSVDIMTKLLGQNRVEFLLELHNGILIAEISYDVLDILTSNIAALCIKNTKGKARVYIKTAQGTSSNKVVFTDDPSNCDDLLTKLAEPENTDMHELDVIAKIIKENSGKLSAAPNRSNGFSVAFSLPKIINRPDILREDKKDNAEKEGYLSKLGIGLSTVMDADTDFSKFNLKG